MCLHRHTATSQARETDESAAAQNWWWPKKKKKKCFGRAPKSNDTEGWWDSDAAMDSASLNTEALQRKQMRGSPGSVSRKRRGMLSEREKEKEKEGMRSKWRQQDEREPKKEAWKRKMRRECEERTEGQTDVFLLHCEQRFSLIWILAALFYVLRGCITYTRLWCFKQASTHTHNVLVIKSRSNADVTLDNYRLINYCVPPLSF